MEWGIYIGERVGWSVNMQSNIVSDYNYILGKYSKRRNKSSPKITFRSLFHDDNVLCNDVNNGHRHIDI